MAHTTDNDITLPPAPKPRHHRSKWLRTLTTELGLTSLHSTGSPAYILIATRTTRMLAYSTPSLVLATLLSLLPSTPSPSQIGLFMTLTLVGDVVLSLLLTLVADRVGRRRVLLLGAVLMIVSGTVFILSENFWILLLAAVLGVISVTGGDFGPFRAVEESVLAGLTAEVKGANEEKTGGGSGGGGRVTGRQRADVLSWYVTVSALGSAIGTEGGGWVVEWLKGWRGWDVRRAYHAVFGLYVVAGVANVVLILMLGLECEEAGFGREMQQRSGTDGELEEAAGGLLVDEEEDSDGDNDNDEVDSNTRAAHIAAPAPTPAPTTTAATSAPQKSYFSSISPSTRRTMYPLWLLLSLDSLADGMTSYALTSFYLTTTYTTLSPSLLGTLFSASYFLSAASTIFAAPLSARIGLVNTMVFTHLPSSLAVLFFPLPERLWGNVVLLLVRAGLNNMDQAPRAAFISKVVKEGERTAVMGITGLLRTGSAAVGPWVTGWVAGEGTFWVAFVVAGVVRVGYDLGLWWMFVGVEREGKEKKGEEVELEMDEMEEEEEEEEGGK